MMSLPAVIILGSIPVMLFSTAIHEIGHLVAAKYFGYKITEIVLFHPLNAHISMEVDLDNRNFRNEFIVTCCGPAATLILAVLSVIGLNMVRRVGAFSPTDYVGVGFLLMFVYNQLSLIISVGEGLSSFHPNSDFTKIFAYLAAQRKK